MGAQEVSEINYNIFGGKPQEFIYEDDLCVVFDELRNPQAPVHFLVVPRKVLPRFSETSMEDEKLLGHLLLVAHDLALKNGLNRSGYHMMMDEDFRRKRLNAVHVFGRALHHMIWPTGPGAKL